MVTLDIWILVPPRTINTLMDLWEHAGFRACASLGACALVAIERAIELEETAWYTPLALVEHAPAVAAVTNPAPFVWCTPHAPAVPPVTSSPYPHHEDPENLVDLFLALPTPLALRVDNARVTRAIAHLLPSLPPRAQYLGDLLVVGARSLAHEHAAHTPVGADLCPEEEDA